MAVIAVILTACIGVGAQQPKVQQAQPQVKLQAAKKYDIADLTMVKHADYKSYRLVQNVEDSNIIRERTVLLKKNSGMPLEVLPNYKGKPLTWKSSNTAVVTVDTKGNLTAKNIAGQTQVATITATSGEITDECTVYVVDKLIADATAVGYGIDITAAEAFSEKFMKKSPIFDLDLVYARNLWGTNTLTNSEDMKDASGTTVSQTIKDFNTKNKVSYSGAFSASAEVNFKSSNSVKKTAGFTRIKSEIRSKSDYLKELNLSRLKEYITETFRNDLKTKDAAYMVNTYGSHVASQCFYGGVVQLDFVTSSYKEIDTKEITARAKAGALGIGVKSDNTWKTEQQNFESNSDLHIYSEGGVLGALNLVQFKKNYQGWVSGIKGGKLNVVAGFDDAKSLIPLWEIARVVDDNKAKLIKAEFDKRLGANGIRLAGIDADYAKRKSVILSTGKITKSSPNTTVTREKGDLDITSGSSPDKNTNWELELTFEPRPSSKTVRVTYMYRVAEVGGDNTTFRMDGYKDIDVRSITITPTSSTSAPISFTNTAKEKVTLKGTLIGRHGDWHLAFTNYNNSEFNEGKLNDIVRKLQIRVDGPESDSSTYIGFDAEFNFFYVSP